jgi:hypothetical protein
MLFGATVVLSKALHHLPIPNLVLCAFLSQFFQKGNCLRQILSLRPAAKTFAYRGPCTHPYSYSLIGPLIIM